jgi:hypothetical protein
MILYLCNSIVYSKATLMKHLHPSETMAAVIIGMALAGHQNLHPEHTLQR